MRTMRAETPGGAQTMSTFPIYGNAASQTASMVVPRVALWGMLAAKIITGWGVQWDVEWHVRVGRDTFWIAPHLITYAGVTISTLLSWGMLAWYTLGLGRSDNLVRVLGAKGTRGFHFAALGVALTVLAAPIDDLWHRLFGLDVTLWSPPHLLGILGGLVVSAACFTIAREVHPAQPAARLLAQVLAGSALYRGLALVAQPAFLLSYAHGDLWFHSPAILSALLLPLALVLVAILSGRRWSPALVVLTVIATTIVGQWISNTGFDWLKPVSVIDSAIAQEPDSPIAIASRIARENGEAPGRGSLVLIVVSLLAAGAMSVTDARRRPVASAVTYGVVVFVLTGWLLSHTPAFGPRAPGLGPTLVGLAIAILAAAASGRAGSALARVLGPGQEL